MLTMEDADGRRRAHEDALLAMLRRRVDLFDAVGVLFISAIVPVALAGYVPLSRTIPWALLSCLCVAVWTNHRLPWDFPSWTSRAGLWGSSVLWAALPWLVGSAFVHDEVAIILLAICGFGLATDALFVPQTVRLHLSPMMLFYATSYVIAFMVNGRWLGTLALTVFTTHLVAGSVGLEAIKRRILRLEEEAAAQASVDGLTGLASRAGARSYLQDQLDAGRPVVCIAIDIDHFTSLNAHLGSQRADALLCSFADRLRALLNDGWFLARVRSDQFVAIGNRPPSIAQLEALPVIELHPKLADIDRQTVSVSAGIATTETAPSLEALRRQAGLALRQAKRGGRQQIVHATPRLLAEAEAETVLTERALAGLSSGEFVAWAQPIVDLDDETWVGFELLARWPQADGSIVTPDRFISVIEAQGASRLLGHVMLDEAVALLTRLGSLGRTDVFVTVNLSPLHLIADDLPDRIERAVARSGIDPKCLVLEMTEGQQLPDIHAARQAVERLREVGVGIASDDVGSGWASLNQLMSTPFTHVKVDRDLINGAQRRGASDLLASIRDVAAGAGQVAIAEGIESEAERAFVRRARFRMAQGYLFARPMPIDEAIEGLGRGSISADIA